MLDFQLVSYFTNFAVQNVSKAFVYITDLTSTLNVLKLITTDVACYHITLHIRKRDLLGNVANLNTQRFDLQRF